MAESTKLAECCCLQRALFEIRSRYRPSVLAGLKRYKLQGRKVRGYMCEQDVETHFFPMLARKLKPGIAPEFLRMNLFNPLVKKMHQDMVSLGMPV